MQVCTGLVLSELCPQHYRDDVTEDVEHLHAELGVQLGVLGVQQGPAAPVCQLPLARPQGQILQLQQQSGGLLVLVV